MICNINPKTSKIRRLFWAPVFPKYFLPFIVILSFVIITGCQNNKREKGKIQESGKVNMKELQEREKHLPPDSLKNKQYETGPLENTKGKRLPVPENAEIIKSGIKPGQIKKDSN